eukprot:c5538_g1_i1 orf=204-458(+)
MDRRFETNPVVGDPLVNMLVNRGSLSRWYMECIDKMLHCSTVSWNIMIAVYLQNDSKLFQQIQLKGVAPDRSASSVFLILVWEP